MVSRRPLVVAAMLAVCGASSLAAQTALRGVVVTPDSAPVAGAVVALLGPGGVALERAVTRPDGRFDLRVPRAGTFSVAVERAGHDPFFPPPIDVAEGVAPPVRLVAESRPLRFAAAPGVELPCRLGVDLPDLSLELWQAVRIDLRALDLTESARLLLKEVVAFDRSYDVEGKRLVEERRAPAGRIDGRPFLTAAPATLFETGYMTTAGGDMLFQPPDARLFLADRFLTTYCLTPAVADRSVGGRAQAGLTFRPARRRDKVTDIEGTFWLDRETRRLAEVEYRFIPPLVPKGTFGGSQRIAYTPSGKRYLDQWVQIGRAHV